MGFDADIKPLFRKGDRDSMEFAFDLWSYDEVVANAARIYERLADGTMPCFDSWDDDRVARFRDWMDAGFPR
jgi:hypothetical protein